MSTRSNYLTKEVLCEELKKFSASFELTLHKELQILKDSLPALIEKEVKKQITTVQSEIDNSIDFTVKNTVDSKLIELREKMKLMEENLEKLKSQIIVSEKRCKDTASYSYSYNVLLHGANEEIEEDCLKIVKSELARLHVPVNVIDDLEGTAHRLGKVKPQSSRPRPIVFKLIRRPSRDIITNLSFEGHSKGLSVPYFSKHFPPFSNRRTPKHSGRPVVSSN